MSGPVELKIAPPDRASAILKAQGYDIGPKTLRIWYKQGKIPGCDTGRRVLLNIDRVIDYLNTGDPVQHVESGGGIRAVRR